MTMRKHFSWTITPLLVLSFIASILCVGLGIYAVQNHAVWYRYKVGPFEVHEGPRYGREAKDAEENMPHFANFYKVVIGSTYMGIILEAILALLLLIFMTMVIADSSHARWLRYIAVITAFFGMLALVFAVLFFLGHPRAMRTEDHLKAACDLVGGPCRSFSGKSSIGSWGPGGAWVAVLIAACISAAALFMSCFTCRQERSGNYEQIQ